MAAYCAGVTYLARVSCLPPTCSIRPAVPVHFGNWGLERASFATSVSWRPKRYTNSTLVQRKTMRRGDRASTTRSQVKPSWNEESRQNQDCEGISVRGGRGPYVWTPCPDIQNRDES